MNARPPDLELVESTKKPETFATEVDAGIAYVSEMIGKYLEDMATLITEHAREGGTLAGIIGGGLIGGPIGAVIGGFTGAEIGADIEEKFASACKQIDEAWQAGQESIRKSVGSVMGDPLKMSTIASSYRDAATALGAVSNNVESTNGMLAESFEGKAYAAFNSVASKQNAAMKGLGDMLLNAADLLDDNELNLVKFWIQELQNLIDLAMNFVNKTGELGDAGTWFTLGAGVAMETIGSTVSAVAKVVTSAGEYMADLNIGSAGDWDGLNSSFGKSGLENGLWPGIDVTNYNINDEWGRK